jgi:uncharacterized protein (TIGR03083 family)
MDADSVFEAARRERLDVAELVEGLDDQRLAQPSLCRGWDVRTVAAHLASATAPSRRRFLLAALRHAGRAHRANDAVARQVARQPVADIVRMLRHHADSRFAPPVVGPAGPLTDVLVHHGDMRLPLQMPYDPPPAHVRPALEFVTEGRPVGFVARGVLRGLRLTAEDVGLSWGHGAEMTGRGIDLLMAACGRASVLQRLDGPGADVLSRRLGGRH